AERALAKIETAAGQHLDTAGVDIRLATQDRWLALAQRAVDEQRAVELRYYAAARDESTHRVVDPVRVFFADGMAYLEAWCRQAEGMRVFRLDRFEDARLLDEPARLPDDLPASELKPADLAGGVYRPAPEHLLVELRLGPGWEWVSDYYPCETVEAVVGERGEAEHRVSLRVANPAWVAALVRRSGGAVSVLAPGWLARSCAESAAAALAEYRTQ
ncbi:MAG TPA: WYL domain-containing protein, partial [Jatrophihabitans sp.]|nr:WYL domain-containing protein [Jatrophihabitans sp.]